MFLMPPAVRHSFVISNQLYTLSLFELFLLTYFLKSLTQMGRSKKICKCTPKMQ